MTLHTPLHMQPASGDPDLTYTGLEERLLIQATYPYEGIVDRGPALGKFTVQQRGAGANFSVDVLSGAAVITGDDTGSQMNYLCWSDATFNLVTPSAPGSGTRLHRVGLQLRDKLNNGAWTQYDFTPALVQDTGAGFPAEPASFLTLAQVSIAAGQANVSNGNITDLRSPASRTRVWKASDLSRTSGTLTADPDLSIIAAAGTWEVDAFLNCQAATSADLIFALVAPAGATGSWGGTWHHGGEAWANCHGHTSFTVGETDSVVTESGVNTAAHVTGILINAAAGPVYITWGVLNTGPAVILRRGSSFSLRRCG
jgi:hypothetical protein